MYVIGMISTLLAMEILRGTSLIGDSCSLIRHTISTCTNCSSNPVLHISLTHAIHISFRPSLLVLLFILSCSKFPLVISSFILLFIFCTFNLADPPSRCSLFNRSIALAGPPSKLISCLLITIHTQPENTSVPFLRMSCMKYGIAINMFVHMTIPRTWCGINRALTFLKAGRRCFGSV